VGVVTDRDLRHYLFTPEVFRELGSLSVETLLKAVPVSEIMSAPVVTVDATNDLEVAAGIMLEDGIGSLPVVERGRVVGILAETDLLRHIVRADARSGPEVEEIVVSFP
jgi:acetoin utilization protein AcuB